MDGNPKLRLLSYGVMLYMLLAFIWWSVLLVVKNDDAFQAKKEYLRLIKVAQGTVKNDAQFNADLQYKELVIRYQRQEWMIAGEAIVFILSLIAGIWFINRGYHKEVQLAQQKRNFLLSISHELKSPIASIRLIIETFQKRKLEPEQVQKLTSSGLKENDRLTSLVNNLLMATKLETAYVPSREWFDMTELLGSCVDKFTMLNPNARIEFHDEDLEIAVFADKLGFESVLTNVVENAIKYAGEDAAIKIALKDLGETVSLTVEDNGNGIPDKEKSKIFDRFYRVGNEEVRQAKGTGLGLYIVKQIITAHKGEVQIVDAQPNGSRFIIQIPKNNK